MLIIIFCSGKSESITIINEGQLSKEDIERVVQEAEYFASEDEFQRKGIQALNSLSSFVYGLKSQLDKGGHGGKIDADSQAILVAFKDTADWISASTEDLEEKLSGECSILKLWIRVRLMDILQRSKA